MKNGQLNCAYKLQWRDKTILFVIFLLINITNSFADKTTKNNYYGSWGDNNSWVGGLAPNYTSLPSPIEEDYNIYGYINVGSATTSQNLTFSTNKESWSITIYDTLVVYGDVNFQTDAMNLDIKDGGLLIIIGDLDLKNKTDISSNGNLIVTGEFAKNGSQGSYTGSGNVYASSYNVKPSTLIPVSQKKNTDSDLQNDLPDVFDFISGGGSIPLPVELLSFSATPDENGVLLQWSTASELNNDFFTLEKSRNGKDFEVMGHVEGNGTSHTRIDYSFTDRQPYLGLSYYRLSQTDYDGTTEVFPAISLLYSNSKNISVYPNPIDGQSARLRATGKQSNAPVIMNIYDLQGKIVLQKSFTTDSFGNLDKELVLEDALEKGTYILELSTSSSKDYIKLSRE